MVQHAAFNQIVSENAIAFALSAGPWVYRQIRPDRVIS
jgi:hypothetical protein